MNDAICTFCGGSGHRAHACPRRRDRLDIPLHPDPHAMTWTESERRAILEYGHSCYDAGVADERAKLLRKFDAYVPADQVASLRWRVAELEELVRVQAAERGALVDRLHGVLRTVGVNAFDRSPPLPRPGPPL